MALTPDLAQRFARITLGHIGREWPYSPNHVLAGPEDLVPPRVHHPIFHGSFDWHSCVHSWWQLLTIRRLFPNLPESSEIAARAGAMLTPANVAGEIAFLDRPTSTGFARPYGLAWALALHGEACHHPEDWGATLEPLARFIAARLGGYFTKLTYPIRVGTHFNSSFAMILALDWAREHDAALADLIERRAQDWFGKDRDCQAWEPGGDEFLSSALTEALLMRRVLGAEFAAWFGAWFDAFLPRAAYGEPAALFTPAIVSDRSDGKIAHLDGLNLSRAWCWRALGFAEAADTHLAAALPHLDDDYTGAHWLPSFALLALLPADAASGTVAR